MAAAEVQVIPVVCGPTGAGKSAIARWLARRDACTIISADSRQVFCRFDIGTAKPTGSERLAVPHRGIDIVQPTVRFSAAAWADAADEWITEATAAGRTPLVVGGTGLYLRALFDALFAEPNLDEARRGELERVLSERSVLDLRRWVAQLDPVRAHLGRTQLLRAIEIALLTGRRLSELHVKEQRPARRRARYLLVDPGAALSAQLEQRLDAMLEAGWVDEVRALATTVPDDAPAWKSSGYRALRGVVRGEVSLTGARQSILIETRQYAKRQRTWFRHQLPADLVTPVDPTVTGWEAVVQRWWTQESVMEEEEGTQ